MNYGVLDRRIQQLERQRDREAGFELPSRWYEFLVAPSCPPDKRLHIRGGTVTASAYWAWIMASDFVPDWICDFEDATKTGMDLVFANAGYHLPVIMCYHYDFVATYSYYGDEWFTWNDQVFTNVIGTEVATPTEAEAQIDAWMNGYTQWYQEVMPLWGVIFKNDGQTGVPYAILPIEQVNRGRSYLYRDVRARHNIFG